MIAQFSYVVGLLAAGPLADRVFEPALQPGSPLAGALGWLAGTGPGAGIALLIAGGGVAGAAISLAGYLVPAVRDVEARVQDHAVAAEA